MAQLAAAEGTEAAETAAGLAVTPSLFEGAGGATTGMAGSNSGAGRACATSITVSGRGMGAVGRRADRT